VALQTGPFFINPPAMHWSLFSHRVAALGCHACKPTHLRKCYHSNSETAVERKTPKEDPETNTHSHVPVLPLQLKKLIHQVRHNRGGRIRQHKEKETTGKLL